jgi:hypothetical protein
MQKALKKRESAGKTTHWQNKQQNKSELRKQVKELAEFIHVKSFVKGKLMNFNRNRRVKSTIDIADFWGNKERYLMRTRYVDAYLSLKIENKKKNFQNSIGRVIITQPKIMDMKAENLVREYKENTRKTEKTHTTIGKSKRSVFVITLQRSPVS